MARYQRLTLMEREELSRMLATGHSLRAVAQAIQRAPSTLSRELTRHRTSPVTYRAVPAHQRAQRWVHQPRKPRKLVVHTRLRAAVLHLLAHRWSPEQIAHGLPQRYPDDPTMRISHEAIYTYLYVRPSGALKRELARYLRRRHRFRRPHKVRLSSRPIQDLVSIDERPPEVGGPHGAGALGGRLARGPCQCVRARHPGGTDDTVYRAGATEGEGRGHGASSLRARTADAAETAASFPHLRPRARNAGASALHQADQDAGLFCPSTFAVGARHK